MKEPIPFPTPDAVGDADLVGRAVEGDRWSRDVIYRRHARYLFAVIARLLGRRSEAEEVLQDTFVRGFEKLATLREPAAVRAWLAQIAIGIVRHRLRRARLMHFLGLDGADGDATLAALAAPNLAPDERAELALVDRLLAPVRPAHRIAWMLRRVEGLALAEVASTCACSLATVKRRIAAVDAIVERHVRIDKEAP